MSECQHLVGATGWLPYRLSDIVQRDYCRELLRLGLEKRLSTVTRGMVAYHRTDSSISQSERGVKMCAPDLETNGAYFSWG